MFEVLRTTWEILESSAIYILFGFLLAAGLDVALSSSRLMKLVEGLKKRTVFWATLVGIPLPLCSCSVLPTAITLRQRGASKGATMAFLISTPETSVPSILLTFSLLGWVMAVYRPIAAGITAIAAGLLELVYERREAQAPAEIDPADVPSCCSTNSEAGGEKKASPAPQAQPQSMTGLTIGGKPTCCGGEEPASQTKSTEAGESCCGGGPSEAGTVQTDESGCGCGTQAESNEAGRSLAARFQHAMRYSFIKLFDDIFGWMIFGILFAALLQTLIPPEWIATYLGGAVVSMLVMTVVGVPLYVCAEASTPIAAALVAQGMNPGAALVFLLVGPATNIGSLAVLTKLLGRRSVVLYLVVIVIGALTAGAVLNWMLGSVLPINAVNALHHERMAPGWLKTLGAAAFLILGLGTAIRKQWWRGLANRLDAVLPLPVTPRGLGVFVGLAALTAYGLSGSIIVRPGQVGVVRRFGAVVASDLATGLHIRWPRPFETATVVPVERVQRLTLGVVGPMEDPNAVDPAVELEGAQLLGDENIANVEAAVHWRAQPDAVVHFAFGVADQEELVRSVALGALREALGGYAVAEVFTDQRDEIERTVGDQTQARLDAYGAGVRIECVELLSAHAPEGPVHNAFRNVASALEQRDRAIDLAHAKRIELLAEAQGQATVQLEEARGAAADAVRRARGEAAGFKAMLAAYQASPGITRLRLELEMLEQVLPGMRLFIKPPAGGEGELDIWLSGESSASELLGYDAAR